MLAEWDTDKILMVLAIVVPLGALLIGFVWKWQEKQDTKLARNCTRTTILETKIEEHKEELDKGVHKFEGIAAELGSVQTTLAANGVELKAVQTGQVRVEGKLDTVIQHLAGRG